MCLGDNLRGLTILINLIIKEIYGLKQGPGRGSHALLAFVLCQHGFLASTCDTSLFIVQRPDVTIFFVGL
jgi:hypothetical protein